MNTEALAREIAEQWMGYDPAPELPPSEIFTYELLKAQVYEAALAVLSTQLTVEARCSVFAFEGGKRRA